MIQNIKYGCTKIPCNRKQLLQGISVEIIPIFNHGIYARM